ncbi:MAG: hypothetical protein CUN48_10155, partial [Candidatus Thermofonsia Clade 3 bacterium]
MISATVTAAEALSSPVRLVVSGSGGEIEFDGGIWIAFVPPEPVEVVGNVILESDAVITRNLDIDGDLIIRQGAVVTLTGQRVITA